MDRGNFLNDLIGGRMRPRVVLDREIPTLTATIVGDPPRCIDPDTDQPMSIQDLCWTLALRCVPDAALQLRWPDRTPAVFVASIHECAGFSESRPSPTGRSAGHPTQLQIDEVLK